MAGCHQTQAGTGFDVSPSIKENQMINLTIVSGSPRQNSLSLRIAKHLHTSLVGNGRVSARLLDLREHPLPLLQSVFKSVAETPDEFKNLAEVVFASDAFILVTPEYNGSYSAALKNLLDHFPKQRRKVFGIVTATTGALGGVRAALQLQELVYAIFGIGSPYMLVVPHVDKKFGADGELLDIEFKKNIDLFINELLWLAERIKE